MSLSHRSWMKLLLGLLVLLVAACGDSNDINNISGQQGNVPVRVFTGPFLGANNLGARTATLNLNVANTGAATGTVTVAGVNAQAIEINPGVYDIAGLVDLTTGAMNLTGNFPGVGPFTINGTLPVGNNQGGYTMNVNGQTFAGTIQNASLGVPTPPGGGNTTGGTTGNTTGGTTGNTTGGTTGNTTGHTTGHTTGGTTGGEQHLIRSGTLSNFSFQPGAGYNGVNPPVSASSTITGAVTHGSATENLVAITISDITISAQPRVRTLVFGVTLHNGQDLEVGKTYNLVSNANDGGALLSLSEGVGTQIDAAWAATAGSTTGTVTIVSLTETGVKLNFDFSNVIVNSEVANNTAAGTFSVSGTVDAPFAPMP